MDRSSPKDLKLGYEMTRTVRYEIVCQCDRWRGTFKSSTEADDAWRAHMDNGSDHDFAMFVKTGVLNDG